MFENFTLKGMLGKFLQCCQLNLPYPVPSFATPSLLLQATAAAHQPPRRGTRRRKVRSCLRKQAITGYQMQACI
jgi:hypothetical protein